MLDQPTQRRNKYNFITKVLFDAEILHSNISMDVEYAVDCTMTCTDAEEGTFDVEINRMAVQSGVYDDGQMISMSPWARVDMSAITAKTIGDIEREILIKFFDSFGDDGELYNDEFPALPAMVVSEYEPTN